MSSARSRREPRKTKLSGNVWTLAHSRIVRRRSSVGCRNSPTAPAVMAFDGCEPSSRLSPDGGRSASTLARRAVHHPAERPAAVGVVPEVFRQVLHALARRQ